MISTAVFGVSQDLGVHDQGSAIGAILVSLECWRRLAVSLVTVLSLMIGVAVTYRSLITVCKHESRVTWHHS